MLAILLKINEMTYNILEQYLEVSVTIRNTFFIMINSVTINFKQPIF